jgi:hypothetical protein
VPQKGFSGDSCPSSCQERGALLGLHTRISPSHNTRGRWSLSGVARETTPGSGVEFATKIAQRAHRKAGAAEDGEPGRVTVGADLCGDDAPTVPSNPNSSRRAAISCARTAATGYARAWTPLDLNVPVLCLGCANTAQRLRLKVQRGRTSCTARSFCSAVGSDIAQLPLRTAP